MKINFENSFDISAQPPNSPEETIDLKKMFEEFSRKTISDFNQERPAYEIFASNRVPEFVFSEGVKMNFTDMTLHLDVKFFSEKGFNREQMIWAGYHEVAHFFDFLGAPKEFLENFEHIKNNARETAKEIKDKMIQDGRGDEVVKKEKQFQEQIEKAKLNKQKTPDLDPFEARAYSIWHTFYNCLDDVYVNSLVAQRKKTSFGQNGRHQKSVSDLYEQVLFKESDFSKQPLSQQFSYYFLRKSMLPDQEMVLDPVAQEMLDREIDFYGQKFFVRDLYKELQAKNFKGINCTERYIFIQEILEPLFKELLKKDLDKWQEEQGKKEQEKQKENKQEKNEQNEKSGQSENQDEGDKNNSSEDGGVEDDSKENSDNSSGKGGKSGENEDYGDQDGDSSAPMSLEDYFEPKDEHGGGSQGEPTNSKSDGPLIPGFIDGIDNADILPDEIEDILKRVKDFKEGKSEKQKQIKSPEQLQQEAEKKWCNENVVVYENFVEYQEYVEKVSPYIDDLARLWMSIVHGKGEHFKKRSVASRDGEINIDRFIKYYADVMVGKSDELKLFDRRKKEMLPANKPELIRFRFIGDTSGSMDNAKIEILKQTYVLLMESFRKFNEILNLSRSQTKTVMRIDTEGWLYGSENLTKVKTFQGNARNYSKEKAEIINSFGEFGVDRGFTHDDAVYRKIIKEMKPGEESSIRSGKTMEIIFQVTDGIPNDGHEPTALVKELENKGVIVNAFQIGLDDQGQDSVFNRIWNSDGKTRGHVVGLQIEKLLPSIVEALKTYLGDVEI